MKLIDYFRDEKPPSATIARERLQIILAHERTRKNQPDYLPQMQQEILDVVRKYAAVDQDEIEVQVDQNGRYSVLELNILLKEY